MLLEQPLNIHAAVLCRAHPGGVYQPSLPGHLQGERAVGEAHRHGSLLQQADANDRADRSAEARLAGPRLRHAPEVVQAAPQEDTFRRQVYPPKSHSAQGPFFD